MKSTYQGDGVLDFEELLGGFSDKRQPVRNGGGFFETLFLGDEKKLVFFFGNEDLWIFKNITISLWKKQICYQLFVTFF